VRLERLLKAIEQRSETGSGIAQIGGKVRAKKKNGKKKF